MTRLTRSARGLMVAIAVLALTGGAALAARSLPSAATAGTQHASSASGRMIPSTRSAPAANHGAPDADETPEPAETPDAEDKAPSDTDRAQNHGWFVSQAANAETPAGFDHHGAYVSSIAKGDAGRPDAAATGAAKSAEGKATAASSRAAHQH